MNARLAIKKIARLIVTTCVGFTVSNVLTANTNVNKTHQKVEVLVGSMVVGSMVADQAGTYTDDKVDAAFDWYDTLPFRKTTA